MQERKKTLTAKIASGYLRQQETLDESLVRTDPDLCRSVAPQKREKLNGPASAITPPGVRGPHDELEKMSIPNRDNELLCRSAEAVQT